MEDELDDIAGEKRDWVGVVRDFYTPFEKDLAKATESLERVKLPDEVTEEMCPNCGKPMVIKTGRFGKFLACSGYPECKTTRSYQIKTGVECPECGSELIEKVNKKKKKFYGCSNYPDCTFATNYKPLKQKCSKCEGLTTTFRQNYARCIKCGNRDKLQE